MDLADMVTVLRDGRNAGTLKRGEFDHETLIQLMLVESPEERTTATRGDRGRVILEVEDLSSQSGGLNGINVSVAQGEIVGLAGMLGSGRSELFECLFGIRESESGRCTIDGKAVKPTSPIAAMALGIGMVPEDRKAQGIFTGSSVWKNVSLASTHDLFFKLGIVREGEARDVTRDQVKKLDIRCRNIFQDISYLSGGNQQKTVLARWISRNPQILLLDDPTAGIDVGAKAEIHGMIRELARSGVAVLMVSSEFDELIDLCHRVLVMRDGRIVDEFDGDAATEQLLVLAATGGAR